MLPIRAGAWRIPVPREHHHAHTLKHRRVLQNPRRGRVMAAGAMVMVMVMIMVMVRARARIMLIPVRP